MPETVTDLVTRSWYLSGIVSKEYETVSGEQLNDGVDMLNAFLAVKTADQRLIPYYDELTFPSIIGQEKYFIENLIQADTITYEIASVRYPMISMSRWEYFGTARANEISSLSFQYYIERCFKGSNLYVYFNPSQIWTFTIHGKFSLGNVTLNQDLSETLDQYYLEYLRYGLANYMCQEYNIVFQPQNNKYLLNLEKILFDISPIDFTVRKFSMLQLGQSPDNYADANIGKGWTTDGGW